MLIKIRIYKIHDWDLCRLYQMGKKQFSAAMKQAVKAYFRDEKFYPVLGNAVPEKRQSMVHEIKISFDDEKDADVIEGLSQIMYRQRNSFVKNLMRRYLPLSDMALYMEDPAFAPAKPFPQATPPKDQTSKKIKEKEIVNSEIEKSPYKSSVPKHKASVITKPKPEPPLPAKDEIKSELLEEDDYDLFADFGKLIG